MTTEPNTTTAQQSGPSELIADGVRALAEDMRKQADHTADYGMSGMKAKARIDSWATAIEALFARQLRAASVAAPAAAVGGDNPNDAAVAKAFRKVFAENPEIFHLCQVDLLARDSATEDEDKGYWIVEKTAGHTRIYNAATGDSCEIECGDDSPHAEILRQLAGDAKEWGRPRAFITGAKIIDGVHVIIAKPTSDLLPEQLLVRYDDYLSKATPAAPVGGFVVDGSERDELLKDYVDDYEYMGEDEAGREGCYRPNERERLLIEDAIRGWEALQ